MSKGLKDMLSTYIDCIYEGKVPDGLFIKNKKGVRIDKKTSEESKNEKN